MNELPEGVKEALAESLYGDDLNWVSQDECGEWWGYIDRPIVHGGGWDAINTLFEFLCSANPNPNWKETLTELK